MSRIAGVLACIVVTGTAFAPVSSADTGAPRTAAIASTTPVLVSNRLSTEAAGPSSGAKQCPPCVRLIAKGAEKVAKPAARLAPKGKKAGKKARSAPKGIARTDEAVIAGVLREAAHGRGDFGLGSATRAQADIAGRAWVGRGARTARDGSTLVSRDGMRVYRRPAWKDKRGKWQANYQRKEPGQQEKKMAHNGHLDIVDMG